MPLDDVEKRFAEMRKDPLAVYARWDKIARSQPISPFKKEKPIIIGETREKVRKRVEPNERNWKEADFQTEFGKWAVKNGTTSAAFELKSEVGNSIAFSRLADHQKEALLDAKHGKKYHKIADTDWSTGNAAQKPFDCFILIAVKAFIAVMFHVKERGNKTFYLIDIDSWVAEENISERKSLTEARAMEIGRKCVL